MILVDFSAVSIAALLVNQSEINFKLEEGYLRHVVLNSIRAITVKHRPVFGTEVVIATDARGLYWRDEVFPQYKWKRRQKKKDSRFDWDLINATFDKVKTEIKTFLPYKVVGFPRAEADDVIAVLAKHRAEKPVPIPGQQPGFDFGDYIQWEPTLIVSGDKDFIQLQVHSNIKQFKNTTSANSVLNLFNDLFVS